MIYIITVTFNNADGLIRTFSSLTRQTYEDLHWIVVDGGSNDGTAEWLRALDSKIPMSWLSEPDNGIYDAMNKATSLMAERSSGSYCIFMNAGDEFASDDVLQMFSAEHKARNKRVVYGDANYVRPVGGSFMGRARPPHLIWRGMPTSHQAMFFRVDVFSDMKFNLGQKLGADYELLCRCYARFGREQFEVLPFPVCNFYLDGVSVKRRREALAENFQSRVRALKMPTALAAALYLAHYLHMHLKRWFPQATSKIRAAR